MRDASNNRLLKPRKTSRAVRCSLELAVTARTGKHFVTPLRRSILKAHELLNSPLRQLSVVLVGDQKMSQIHVDFLGIKGTTDVLTFPLDVDRLERVTSGEVVVCVPEAVRQARQRHGEPGAELLLYVLHGMLHLCGFDDKTERDFRRMHRREDQILTAMGIGPVFCLSRPAAPHTRQSVPRKRMGGAR